MSSSESPQESNPTKASVLLVDRRPIFNDGIEAILNAANFDVIGKVDNHADAVRRSGGNKPDLVLIGPYMGLASDPQNVNNLVHEILEVSPDTKIMLTVTEADREREALLAGLKEGATGLIDMEAPTEKFIAAAQDLSEGKSHLPSHIAMSLFVNSDSDPISSLSVRELEVLAEIALGFTSTEIAEHTHLSVRTVESHRARIHQKLGTSSRAELVRIALDQGLIRPSSKSD